MDLQQVSNPTKEDLQFAYDSVGYVLKSGESMTFPAHLAQHAAKKLADRENNRKGNNASVVNHQKLMEKFLGAITPLAQPDQKPKSQELAQEAVPVEME